MYIIAIGWLYVVVLMAFTETSVVAGVMTFLFYGALPVAVIIYLGGTKARRRRRLLADQGAGNDNRSDTEADQ